LSAASRIVRGLRRRLGDRVEAVRIRLRARYERVEAPELDAAFREALLGPRGVLAPLLATCGVGDAETRLLAGEMRVFGAPVRLGEPGFSWHRDVHSGHRYPLVPYPRIRIEIDRGADILIPWELSRLQQIPTLVAAHRRSGDERLPAAFRRLIDSWRDANPYLFGVNWQNEMEIALRGLNLAVGMLWFGASPLDARVLWAHAETVLARDFSPPKRDGNNHLLVSAAGLLCIALCHRGAAAETVAARVAPVLEAEILRQFRDDGGCFEAAVHYHQLSLEASLVAGAFLAARGRRLGAAVVERLGRALDLVSSYLAAFGRSPQFGDSSDARVLVFDRYFDADPLDHGFLAPLARVALGGDAGSGRELQTIFPASGYGFHREEGYGLCATASPVDANGHSGHHHLDKTSFVLRVGGQPVLVDPGTLAYTGDIHRRYAQRATRAHNVVVIDGREQGEIRADAVFGRPLGLRAWMRSPSAGSFELGHDGYRRFPGLGEVLRRIACTSREVRIEEELSGSGRHRVEILFHLHPRVRAESGPGGIAMRSGEGILCRLEPPEGFATSFETAAYSAAYGEQEPHPVLVLTRALELPAVVRYAIHVPGEGR